MSAEQVLESVCQGLQSEYGAHTILLYGSIADGSANAHSDLDIVGFGAVGQARVMAPLIGTFEREPKGSSPSCPAPRRHKI